MFIGLTLIVIGAIFLLQNLGYLTSDAWDVIWPLLLIILGLSMIIKRKRGWHGPWCWCSACRGEEEKK